MWKKTVPAALFHWRETENWLLRSSSALLRFVSESFSIVNQINWPRADSQWIATQILVCFSEIYWITTEDYITQLYVSFKTLLWCFFKASFTIHAKPVENERPAQSSQFEPFVSHRWMKLMRIVSRGIMKAQSRTVTAAYGSCLFDHLHEACIRLCVTISEKWVMMFLCFMFWCFIHVMWSNWPFAKTLHPPP